MPSLPWRRAGACLPLADSLCSSMGVSDILTHTLPAAPNGLQIDITALEKSRCTLSLPLADSQLSCLGVLNGQAHTALAAARGMCCAEDGQVSSWTARSHGCMCEPDEPLHPIQTLEATIQASVLGAHSYGWYWAHCCSFLEQHLCIQL